jgi:hypothetical protein
MYTSGFMTINPGYLEAEIGRSMVKGQPGKNFVRPYLNQYLSTVVWYLSSQATLEAEEGSRPAQAKVRETQSQRGKKARHDGTQLSSYLGRKPKIVGS